MSSPAARPAPQGERDVAYHADVAGHQRILEALGAVPDIGATIVPGVDDQSGKWPPLKTLFFVLVFCTTAWATISTALLLAFR